MDEQVGEGLEGEGRMFVAQRGWDNQPCRIERRRRGSRPSRDSRLEGLASSGSQLIPTLLISLLLTKTLSSCGSFFFAKRLKVTDTSSRMLGVGRFIEKQRVCEWPVLFSHRLAERAWATQYLKHSVQWKSRKKAM